MSKKIINFAIHEPFTFERCFRNINFNNIQL